MLTRTHKPLGLLLSDLQGTVGSSANLGGACLFVPALGSATQ